MKSQLLAVLDDEIAELRNLLALREKLRLQVLANDAEQGAPALRFHGKKILDSTRILLLEAQRALPLSELQPKLIAGGAVQETERKEKNIEDSVRKSLKHGKLTERNGLIGLPEWGDEFFSAGTQTLPGTGATTAGP